MTSKLKRQYFECECECEKVGLEHENLKARKEN
jgi:hypothetical protein